MIQMKNPFVAVVKTKKKSFLLSFLTTFKSRLIEITDVECIKKYIKSKWWLSISWEYIEYLTEDPCTTLLTWETTVRNLEQKFENIIIVLKTIRSL